MTYFSWLHFTDLHQLEKSDWRQPGIQDMLFKDLEILYDKSGPWDLLLFTGDLTFKGSLEEFNRVNELFNRLWELFATLGCNPKLLAVPGNHDLVWQNPREPEVLLLQNWNTILNVQEDFWEDNSRYRQVVNQTFANYSAWWKNQQYLPQNVNSGLLPGDFAVTLEKEGAKLGIVGLNTSFLQLTGGNYEGKLALHTHQFHAVCGGNGPAWTQNHQVCLLLTHHPPTWLNEEARQHLLGEISAHGRFVVQLCGHTHAAEGIEIVEAFTETRRLWLGRSLFGLDHFGPNDEGQRLHGYSAGRIEISTAKKGTICFWPRKDEIQGQERKLVPDYSFNLTDQQHTEPRGFPLLQPYTQTDEIKKPHPNRTSQSRPLDQTRHPRVFHNLPQPDYERFVGRKAELEQIHLFLSPKHRSWIITIDGIGGIGKSALALEIAYRYLHNYDQLVPEDRFDAMIWMSAKQTVLTAEGISTRRRILHTLDDIYTAIAVALQREDITRASAEVQDEVVRNALIRQRTLLIVDNLETIDDEAVLDFLRELPAPTKAIVTTRHRIDVAYPVRLTGMPWEDAKILIAQECEKKGVVLDPGSAGVSPANDEQASRLRSQENARRLYDRTGGVPLAIVWSIAQMGFGYNVDAVLTRLGQPSGDIARFCFEGAIERIKGKPAHKLLMVLSLCADSASREVLGYATELPELDRDEGLVELEKFSLVNKKGDRFWLLPLTKQFAASELQQSPEKERLREQWIKYFRTLTEEYSGKYWKWANYDWLLAEGENILSIVDWVIAAGHGEIALEFTHAMQSYLFFINRWDKWITYGEQFYNIAQSLNAKQTQAWICIRWLIPFYTTRGNVKRAEFLANQSLSLYKEIDDVQGVCFAMAGLGRVFRRAEKLEEAERILKHSEKLALKHNYIEGIVATHFELGKLARDHQEWEKSKGHWETVIEWLKKYREGSDFDISSLKAALGQLGWIEYHLGNYHRARELMEENHAFFEDQGGKGSTATSHLRLAAIEHALGNREKALQHLQETLFWAERLGMKRELEGAQALLRELEGNPKQPGDREDSEKMGYRSGEQ